MTNKQEEINRGLAAITKYLKTLKPQKVWQIYYTIAEEHHNFTEWERQYFGILNGEEYLLIYDSVKLLYVINVTGDSTLTALSELMDLLARKF